MLRHTLASFTLMYYSNLQCNSNDGPGASGAPPLFTTLPSACTVTQ